MAITRTRAVSTGYGGLWETIAGTPLEVLTELDKKGVRPSDINIIADDCTFAVFRK
jgi:hypothetical protein